MHQPKTHSRQPFLLQPPLSPPKPPQCRAPPKLSCLYLRGTKMFDPDETSAATLPNYRYVIQNIEICCFASIIFQITH